MLTAIHTVSLEVDWADMVAHYLSGVHIKKCIFPLKETSQKSQRTLLLPSYWSALYMYKGDHRGFPGGASGKEPACQCGRCTRHGFNPWDRKIPWRRAQQRNPVFLPGESHGRRGLVGYSPWGCRVRHDWRNSTHTHTHTHTHVCKIASGKHLWSTGISAQSFMRTQRVSMGKWEQGSGGRWYMYSYSWFTLLYSRN